MEAGGYSSARLVENLINPYVGGKKCLHFTLCWVFVFIFRNVNATLHGGLSVRCTSQSGNVYIFSG